MKLGQPYDAMLEDYCSATGAAKTVVLRNAVKEFIARELASNPGMRERYEEAGRRRQGKNVIHIRDRLTGDA